MLNSKIAEIAKKAGMVEYPTGLGIKENTIWGDINISKFAELLIKECADIVNSLESHEGQGDCGTATYIKEHFGV